MKQHRAAGRRLASCFIFAFLSLWSIATVTAQSIDWEKSHGSAVSGYSVQRLDDGGFVAVGAGGNWPSTQGYVIRTNADGDKIWDKSIGTGNPGVWVAAVKKTADGQMAIVGSKNSMPWLWKYDLDGNEKWDRQLMGPMSIGDGRAVVTVPDGIVITGTSSYAGKYNLFVQKFSLTGDSLWSLQLSGKGSDGYGIRQGLDGHFLIAGRVDKGDGYETYLVKVSSSGAMMWERSYPKVAGTFGDAANDVSIAPDGYLLVGSRSIDQNNTQMDAIKVALDGTLSWRKQYGTAGYGGINAVRPQTDGFVLAGYTGTSQMTVARVIRIDLNGGVTADKPLDASFLHYIDQAIPPAKFVVVGGTSDFTKLYLARVDMTATPEPQDDKTFVYYYNNQPLFGFRPSNGWQGDGAGKIKLVSPKDTVRINDMTRIAATHFRIDTTRSSATGSMTFQATGSLLATGARPAGMEVLASGSITGYIDNEGIHLNDPLRSGDWSGLFGSTMTITLIEPETYPSSTSMKLSGTLRIKGMRRCGAVNGDLAFSGLKIMPTTAQISYLDAIQPEPGVCYMNLIATYHPQADSLALYGNFQSRMYFKEGMIAGGYVRNGEFGQLKLATTLDQAPLGPDGLGNISNFTGTYSTLYANWMGSRWPVFNFVTLSGRLYDLSNVIAIDLKDAVMTAPGVLDNDDVTYNMYPTADGWHVQGKSDVHVEWSPGMMRFSPLEDGELGAMARWNGGFYFNGSGSGSAYKQLGKKTTSSGIGKGIVEIPGVPREPYFAVMEKLLSELVFSQLILNKIGGNPNAGSKHSSTIKMINGKAYVTTDSKGYYTGPMEFDMTRRSTDPGFFSPVSFENFSKKMTSRSFTNTQSARQKDKATQAASNEFDVPENARGFYVRIAGIDGPATTSLTSPSGETITAPRTDSSVYITVYDSLRYWWVVDKPAAGKWTVNTITGKDTVQVFVFEPIPQLVVTATQQTNSVSVSWQDPSDDSVMILVDDNSEGFDGLHVATVGATATSAQITLPSELTGCTYYVYLVRSYAGDLQMAYAASSIDNSSGKLAAPAGFAASYNTTEKTATLNWNASQQPAVAGYVIRLVGNGIDSIVTSVFADVSTTSFPVVDPNGLSVAIMSYDTNGTRGCWSALIPLSTSEVKETYVVRSTLDAVVLPNPSRNRASLYLRMDEGSNVSISIYDATGRAVNALSGYYPMGEHDINLQTEQLPSGSYVAVIQAGSRSQTRNFVITR